MSKKDLLTLIQSFPNDPGCYLMKEDDIILYIGKAKNLKKRILSYFQKKQEIKIASLIHKITSIDYIRTLNETEALLLENNLIKKHQPLYNFQLKDDKRYASLFISHEPFPKLEITREKPKGLILGPYPGLSVKDLALRLSDFLQLRKCSLKEFQKRKKVCDYYHLKTCSGTCLKLESESSYTKKLELIEQFFKKKNKKLFSLVEETMFKKAEEEKFEEAHEIKQLYLLLKKFLEEERFQRVESLHHKNSDFLLLSTKDHCSLVRFLTLSQGELIAKKDYFFLSDSLALDSLVYTHYLYEQKKHTLYTEEEFIVLDLNLRKIPSSLKKFFQEQKELLEKDLSRQLHLYHPYLALVTLQNLLQLQDLPRVLEAYDVAVFQGSSPTASQIVFKDGFSSSKDYRYYNLKTLPEGNNDFKMLKEVFLRRLEKKPYPDLILIDGGLPQWRVFKKVLKKLNLFIPFLALAKEKNQLEERLVLDENRTLALKDSHLKTLLVQLRDEAHRFSRKLHHRKEQERYFKK